MIEFFPQLWEEEPCVVNKTTKGYLRIICFLLIHPVYFMRIF